MSDPEEILLRPVVRWPERVEPGGSYRVTVDLETGGPLDSWRYPQEEYAVGCVLDGGTGFAVESAGDTTLVVHRFGGTYGPVSFVARALDAPGDELRLTLLTQGGVPFQTIPLNVRRPVPATTGMLWTDEDAEHRRPYFLVPYPPERPEPLDVSSMAPSRVLTVAAQSVSFTGRVMELHSLRKWLVGDGTRAMLMHGPGGQGKTRLAAAFARVSREEGWQVRAARPAREWDSRSRTEPVGMPVEDGASGLLLIVDDAETWQVEDLLEMLADIGEGERRPVRVLFLARPAGAWWRALASRLGRERIRTSAMELGPLLDDLDLRREGFQAAAEWFANLYGVPYDSAASVVSSGLDIDFEQVLVVQMAALCAVLGGDPFERGDRRPAIASTLLSEEEAFWRRAQREGGITVQPKVMARAVCVASLAGPLSRDEGLDLLRELGFEDPEGVARDHARCYPPAAGGTVLQPISPDRLAEDYLALTFRGDAWTLGALPALLAGPAGPAAMGTLVETARRWPHMARRLNEALREDPGPAVQAGGAVLLRLAEMPDADPDVLEDVEERLPRTGRIDLAIAAAVLAERLIRPRLAAAARDPARQAELYERLAVRRTNVGMYEEAEEAAASAVAIHRVLSAASRDDAAVNRLGRALNVQSANLGRMGRHEESLEQLTESVAVMRRLAADHPEAFEAQLAASLNAQALALAELGRRRPSLEAVQEAVEIYRRRPDTDRADLASALNNLSARLAAVGRREDALEAIAKAVAIHRDMEANDPGKHLPAMAANLHNYSLRSAALGRLEGSVEAAAEAVRIRRELAAAVPDAYEAGLAGALANLAVRLEEQGRLEEAMSASEEAIAIYRTLTGRRPESHRPDLAAALNNYSVQLGAMGRVRDSLAVVEEAVVSYRLLAAERPGVYGPALAAALNNHSVRLGELGEPEAGLNSIREAVAIRRGLAESDPAMFKADLAASLANLGNRLGELGRSEEWLLAAGEAVTIYRELAADHPAAFRPPLATCLDNLAAALKSVGSLDEALESSNEAIAVYRRLAAERPAAFLAGLARNLNNHSVLLGRVGRNDEAVRAARKSVDTHRQLAHERPGVYTGLLGTSLVNLSRVLNSVGSMDEAWASAQEAVGIFRALTFDNPRDNADLAAALTNLSVSLGELGHYREGIDAAQEAVAIYEESVGRHGGLRPALANSLMLLSLQLHADHRFDEALESSGRAIAIGRELAAQNPLVLPSMVRMLRDAAIQFDAAGRRADALDAVNEAMRIQADLVADGGRADDDETRALRQLRDSLAGSYRGVEDESGS
ncbi:tetratricopeptide repeat protein [Actinomadura bangladeshensis]|uniref:Tetratricopeptide repeat protein n=1 Tax=Actinomadura bangladeshensis TaxID=453573 RepID=A0A4R4NRQ3_9ACTN|nr:tetratricopeptide repeat protein [Actinomadura bangladeshensis]TDC09882.1 tetratricopeptide repeat protein [Actinomadura bangladeshensis]